MQVDRRKQRAPCYYCRHRFHSDNSSWFYNLLKLLMDLPTEIWQLILTSGDLDHFDLLNISRVSRRYFLVIEFEA
jgi:hypothetical protein